MIGEQLRQCFSTAPPLAKAASSSSGTRAASNALGMSSARPCSETCVIKPMDRRDVTDGVTCDQEAIKAHEVETPAASVLQRSALCVYALFTVVCLCAQ